MNILSFETKIWRLKTLNKLDGNMQQIHIESNHPPNIIQHMQTSKENWLSNLPSNEKLFQESTPHYDNNLWVSG